LRSALRAAATERSNLAEVIHQRFATLGGVELTPPPRDAVREPEFGG